MPNSEYIVIFVTTEAGEESALISKVLLEQRKAACVSIVKDVDSMYWWNDKIDSASENLLVIKTRAALLEEIIQIVKEIHTNDVPEIIALPIIGGNQDYLDWVGKETL